MANDLLWDQLSDTVLKLDDDLSKLTDQFARLQTHVLELQNRALVDPLKRASGSDEAVVNEKRKCEQYRPVIGDVNDPERFCCKCDVCVLDRKHRASSDLQRAKDCLWKQGGELAIPMFMGVRATDFNKGDLFRMLAIAVNQLEKQRESPLSLKFSSLGGDC